MYYIWKHNAFYIFGFSLQKKDNNRSACSEKGRQIKTASCKQYQLHSWIFCLFYFKGSGLFKSDVFYFFSDDFFINYNNLLLENKFSHKLDNFYIHNLLCFFWQMGIISSSSCSAGCLGKDKNKKAYYRPGFSRIASYFNNCFIRIQFFRTP